MNYYFAHEFTLAEDGALYHDAAQFDLCDARDAAGAYLAYGANGRRVAGLGVNAPTRHSSCVGIVAVSGDHGAG